MSRCFPFPPPGYERKHILEDLHLLKEAKHKEKHKKEKKDKEKKRDKEKDKHGGDGKHRDKKDRKEKHRDKKEKHRSRKDEEDRGKNKDKSSISEETTVSGKPEQSREKVYSKGHSEDRSSFSNEEKYSVLFQGQNGAKESIRPSLMVDNSKFVQELDRRIKDKNGGGSQLPRKIPVFDNRNQEVVAGAPIMNSLGVEKAENKNRRIGKANPQGFGNEDSRNKLVQNTPQTSKIKDEGIPRPLDEQNGLRIGDNNERYKQSGDVKWSDKQKIGDNEDRGKEREKRKEDMVKVKPENKKVEQGKLKDDGKNNLGEFISPTSTDLLKTDSNFVSKGKIRKREDTNTNGFLYDSDIRPNKVQRPAPSRPTENGRKIDSSRMSVKPSQDVPTSTNSVRSHKKDQMMNGMIEAQKLFPSKPSLSASPVAANQITEALKIPRDSNSVKAHKVPEVEDLIAEASRRPPHPDSKYLTNVLTVPTLTDSLEDDEQDWLLTKKCPSRKPRTDPEKNNLNVWSEAVHIDTADVYALPYVIPY